MHKEMVHIGENTIAVYRSAGTMGPTAVLVHGNSASANSFRHQLEGTFGDSHQIVAIDLPGHGHSAPASSPATDYTLGGYATTVVGVAEKLGLTEAVFVGWSLGGHILLEAVDQLPKAAGFVIFGTPPIGIPPAMEAAFFPNPVMAAAFSPELSDEEMVGFTSAFFKPGTAVPQSFLEDIRRTDGTARAVMGGSIQTASYKDEVDITANMTQPLAIFHGEAEQLINGSYFNTLTLPTLWRSGVQIIANAGHAPQWEQPEQFNELLGAFLTDF